MIKRLVTASEYVELERPELDWIIPGLIPKPSLIMLVGPPKVGKSYLALQLALNVANGGNFLNRPCAPGRVLYLQLDTSEKVWRDRLLILKEQGVSLDGPLLMVNPDHQIFPVDILTPAGKAWMRLMIEEANPDLIILDVLRECHSVDENDSTQMKLVGDSLCELTGGKAVVFLHHASKIPADVIDPDPIIYSRGSTYLTGKVDSYWMLYNHRLRIDSRFTERETYTCVPTDTGLFDFKTNKYVK